MLCAIFLKEGYAAQREHKGGSVSVSKKKERRLRN